MVYTNPSLAATFAETAPVRPIITIVTSASATLALNAAASRAARHWSGNLRALAIAQPHIVERVQSLPAHGEWVFARDGSLTLLMGEGKWLGDCSLPFLAGQAMLKSLDPSGTVACFLAPTHAAEVRAAFNKFTPQQAIIVLQPDAAALRILLACDDFSADIAAHRLFFITGEHWPAAMSDLFDQHPGLPTPTQFIKLPTLPPEQADPLIGESQKRFATALNARAERIRSLREQPRDATHSQPRIGVIANSQFKLWDDAGAALAEALHSPMSGTGSATTTGRTNASTLPSGAQATANGDRFSPLMNTDANLAEPADHATAPPNAQGHASLSIDAGRASASPAVTLLRLDPDIPIFAGPLATAEFCRGCDAIVTADSARCDFPDVLPLSLPWVTWVTRGRIPLFAAAGAADALLLADAAWRPRAIDQGWPAERVSVAAFRAGLPSTEAVAEKFAGWTILADTAVIEFPRKLDNFSSHRVLWESIAEELSRNPFAADHDPAAYISARAKAGQVDESTLDVRLLIDSLILPTYQQAIVRALRKDRQAVRVIGRGWGEIDEFRPIAAGVVTSRAELALAIASSTRLLHVWPSASAHPIDAAGPPVLRPGKGGIDSLLKLARRPETFVAAGEPGLAISIDRVLSVLPGEFRSWSKESGLY